MSTMSRSDAGHNSRRVISIGAAYLVMKCQGIMDYVQALFSFFISPLLGAGADGYVLETRHQKRAASGDCCSAPYLDWFWLG